MRFASVSIIVLAGIATLALQLSGLHQHSGPGAVDEPGRLHGTHIHEPSSDGHDHSADVDVSVVDLRIVWSKLIPALLPTLAFLLALNWTHQIVWPRPATLLSPGRQPRWRPPLRAPPLSP